MSPFKGMIRQLAEEGFPGYKLFIKNMLSPEDKLILSAVKLHPSVEELEQMNNLIPQVQRWDYLAATAIERGIAPLLHKKLPMLGNSGQIPEPAKSKLQQAYYKTFSRSMMMYEHFRKVAEAFASHNIPVIALKGIYLSELLYQDIGLRQFSDIDVLVKPEDGEKCLAILAGLGYRTGNDTETEFDKKLEVVHYTPMVLNGVSIEVHVKLHQNNEKYCVDVDNLWRNAQPEIINKAAVYSLCLNDLLVHLCIHLDRHFYQGHVQFTCFNDITNLLDVQAGKIDWEALIAVCKLYNCETQVFRWVVLANKYMNAPVPVDIIEKYGALLTLKDEHLFVKYLHGYVGFTTGMHKHFGNFQYLDTFSDRMVYFWDILFPSKSFMMTKFNIKKPGLVYFYYPYRYYIGLKGLVKLVFK
jgi:hypothetical protein